MIPQAFPSFLFFYIEYHKALGELKEKMMGCDDKDLFVKRYQDFKSKWRKQEEFMGDYFLKTWGDDGLFPPQQWAKCFHSREFDTMDTNNYVESWHNQFKTMYLERRPNRRLDTLLYKLVEHVDTDLQAEVTVQQLNIGRMSVKMREVCKQRFTAKKMAECVPGIYS